MKTSGEILGIVLDAAGGDKLAARATFQDGEALRRLGFTDKDREAIEGAYQAVQPTMSELMDEFFATAEPDHECLNCGMTNYPTNHDCSQF